MDFDELTDRRGRGTAKWDGMARATGVSAPDAIAMWIADTDFAPAGVLQDTVLALHNTAAYGYFVGEEAYHEAVAWWMQTRHGWDAQAAAVFSTHGLGNAIGLCLHAYTRPGDEIILFTPVYHEFFRKIRKAGRVVRESPLVVRDGVYAMDLERLEASLTGREKAVIFCSPHNPAGRVWSVAEQQALAAFCARHDLLLIADEIHHDLAFSGYAHVPLPVAVPEAAGRVVMLTAPSKTFNIAGARIGNVIIPDAGLRARFRTVMEALDIRPNLFGVRMAQAVYSPAGAEWAEELVAYVEGNAALFIDGVAGIPGARAMPMQATYLAWVDFTDTGMEIAEVIRRVKGEARLAPGIGADFGAGGEMWLRFNIAMPRARLTEAIERLRGAFADLQ